MNPDQEFVEFQTEVDLEEWEEARTLLRIVTHAESSPMGHVRLRSDGRVRSWCTTDSYRLLSLDGRPDSTEFELLVPPRLVLSAPRLCGASNTTMLVVRNDPQKGVPTVAVRGDGGEIETTLCTEQFPDVDSSFGELGSRQRGISIEAATLASHLDTVGINPGPMRSDDEEPLGVFVGVDSDGLWLRVNWSEEGPSVMTLDTPGTDEPAFKEMNHAWLSELARAFDGEIDITFGDRHETLLALRSDRLTGGLMPLFTGVERVRRGVEAMIGEMFGPDAFLRDSDGDYQLRTTGVPVWGRLLEGDPHCLSVFAIVTKDIECTPELLTELNDLNSNLRFVRVDWSDGVVTACADLVANTLDPDELFTAFTRVDRVGADLGPMIQSMHGGSGLDRDAERWAAYLETDIVAELTPEGRDYLNGSRAIEHWPFSCPVHVITAWNPYTIGRTLEWNENANLELGSELARLNARFAAAAGESRDGEWVEVGFAVWNMSLETMLRLAREFRQEAIFEITEDEFRLVHALTGHVASSTRRSLHVALDDQ